MIHFHEAKGPPQARYKISSTHLVPKPLLQRSSVGPSACAGDLQAGFTQWFVDGDCIPMSCRTSEQTGWCKS